MNKGKSILLTLLSCFSIDIITAAAGLFSFYKNTAANRKKCLK